MHEEIVDPFIQVFNDFSEVYTACCGTSLDPNHRQVTQNFMDEPCVKLSVTPKVHQIGDHFSDFFDDPLVKKGEGLGVTSDQTIEHMHSYIKKNVQTKWILPQQSSNFGFSKKAALRNSENQFLFHQNKKIRSFFLLSFLVMIVIPFLYNF